MEVEALGRAQAGAQLGDHTLDGSERAARGVLGAERAQLGRAAVAELDRRVVVQVRSDAGQVSDHGDAERPQVVRRPDARAQQERGGVVGARAHDHALRLDDGLTRDAHDGAAHAPAPDYEPLGRGMAGDPQRRSLPYRVEVGQRGIPAHAAGDVDGRGGDARVGIEVVEVVNARNAECRQRRQRSAVERRQLGLLGDAHAHALARGAQERLYVCTRPARHPGCREGVVVERGCPRSRRSRCDWSSRRSCLRAGTRRAARGSRRRCRSRAGATLRATSHRARPPASRPPRRGRSRARPRARGSIRPSARPAGRRARQPVVPPPMMSVSTRGGSSCTEESLRSSENLGEPRGGPFHAIQLGLTRRWRSPGKRRASANCARPGR